MLKEKLAEQESLCRNVISAKMEEQKSASDYHEVETEWLKKQHEERKEQWQKIIKSSKTKTECLEEQVDILKRELRLNICDNSKHAKVKEILRKKLAAYEKRCQISDQTNVELADQLKALKKHMKEEVERLKALDRTAELERALERALALEKQEKERIIKGLEEKHKIELETLTKQIRDMEVDHATVVENLEKVITEKEGIIEEDRRTRDGARFENVLKCKSWELKNIELNKIITALNRRKDLAPKVAELEDIIKDKEKAIRSKIAEIAIIKEEKKKVHNRLGKEKETSTTLRIKLKCAQDNLKSQRDEKREQYGKLKKTSEDLTKANRANSNQADIIARLKCKIRTNEPDLNNLRAKVRQLETYQVRFKGDLEGCMSVISDPQKLKREVIKLRKRYIENNERVQMDTKTEAAYEYRAACLGKQMTSCVRIQKVQSNTLKNMQNHLDTHYSNLNDVRCRYIQTLNEKVVEVDKLKRELKETRKGTKPVQQRVASWMNKKILRTTQVVPQVIVEKPSLCPDDSHQASTLTPKLDNDTITP